MRDSRPTGKGWMKQGTTLVRQFGSVRAGDALLQREMLANRLLLCAKHLFFEKHLLSGGPLMHFHEGALLLDRLALQLHVNA